MKWQVNFVAKVVESRIVRRLLFAAAIAGTVWGVANLSPNLRWAVMVAAVASVVSMVFLGVIALLLQVFDKKEKGALERDRREEGNKCEEEAK